MKIQAQKYPMQSGQPTAAATEGTLENFFSKFRLNIIGNQQSFESPFGETKIIYADWIASGRAYQPIENCIQNEIMPFLANTHTGTTVTGSLMSRAYEEAKLIVKKHVHASSDDVLIFCGSGMTGAVNKLQRILGMRVPERLMDYAGSRLGNGRALYDNMPDENKGCCDYLQLDETLKPVVFVTHMEHHSNQISWLETIATVQVIRPDKNGSVDLNHFKSLLEQFKHRKNKIAAVTACSNVTGIETPYHEIAKMVHEYGGLCFVDFACSAPYVDINMHPRDDGAHLDAIYFSPHKFLGGPGSSGVLIFHKKIYTNRIPDQPGGGTIVYSNPWNDRQYTADIEQREDGGTPPFLQGIKAAMCIRLKEEMGVENIRRRESELLQIVFERFANVKNVQVLAEKTKNRIGVVSFMIRGAHYNLIVKMLNDRFGVQTRGGCSCAGTYGHLLLQVDKMRSHKIWDAIRSGNLSCKPGWVRLSVHPTMTDAEIDFIMDAIDLTASHFQEWERDYVYDPKTNEYIFKAMNEQEDSRVENWFSTSSWTKNISPIGEGAFASPAALAPAI